LTKRIGILTSGGDCAGLNAVLRAATYAAHKRGWKIFGIKQGIYGLLSRPVEHLELEPNFGGLSATLLRMGGTVLGALNKGDPFHMVQKDGSTKDVSDLCIEGYHSLKLDALIAIGGDGSLKKLRQLALKGNIPLVGIPKTIDNDIQHTDSLGFDTAVSVATEALDRLHPTASSHNRVMILEVMGRDAGHIALHTGISGGADIILIPEIPFDLATIVAKIQSVRSSGRNSILIVIAESATTKSHETHMILDKNGAMRYKGVGYFLEDYLSQNLDMEVRATILGHVQRGGAPTQQDRLLASIFGAKAVDLIANNCFDHLVTWHNGNVHAIPLEKAMAHYGYVDLKGPLVQTAKDLNISFGA